MSFTWDLPTKVLFGSGRINELHNEKMPGKKALLVTSNGKSMKDSGWLDETIAELEEAGAEVVLFDKIESNPTEPMVMEGVRTAREHGCDFIVALGGGSVLDAVTVISAMVPQNPNDTAWDYIKGGTGGGKDLVEDPIPYIAITTTAGTGSEVDRWGVITNPDTHEKIGFQGGYADLAIVDPKLMMTVPPEYTAYQGFDALFHSLEGYISKYRNAAAQMVQIAAIGNLAQFLPLAINDGDNLDAREKVAFANTMSGYSMELSSCTSEHAMEHAMSGNHPNLPHGAGLIMIAKAYFKFFIDKHVCDDRFIEMTYALGGKQVMGPHDFLKALDRLFQVCGVSELRMSDYGITPDEFPRFAKEAKSTMPGLFECDLYELSEAEIENIYLASYK